MHPLNTVSTAVAGTLGSSQPTCVADLEGQVVKLLVVNIGHLQSILHVEDCLPKQIHSYRRHRD